MRIHRHRKLVSPLKRRRRRRGFAKVLVLGAAIELGRRLGPRKKKLWQRIFDRMPDDFPPKVMFGNVKAIREQNERIIQLLEKHERDKSAHGLKAS